MNEDFESLIQPLAKAATKLNLKRASEVKRFPVTGSHFGGNPYAESGEVWPICPTCKTSLTFICQINTVSGFHQKPEGVSLFTFFYCWECFPWGMSDDVAGTWVVRTYSEPTDVKAEEISPYGEQPQPTVPCTVELERVLSFPGWEDLGSWSKEAEDVFNKVNWDGPWEAYNAAVGAAGGLTDYATVVGGYPHWVQGEVAPTCDICIERMSLLAQIDSEDEADIMWGDLGCVYLFYCRAHPREVKLELQCF